MIIIGYGSISSSTYYLLLPTTSTYYWSTFIKTQFFGFFIFFSKKTLIFNNFYVLEKKFVKFYFLEKNCPQKWGRLILPPHEIADPPPPPHGKNMALMYEPYYSIHDLHHLD
jgi:hypothetical protein